MEGAGPWEGLGDSRTRGVCGGGYQCFLLLYRPVCESNYYSHSFDIVIDSSIDNYGAVSVARLT